MAYAEVADIVEWLKLDEGLDSGELQDRTTLITRLLESATEVIDACCNRSFEDVAEEERTFYPNNQPPVIEIGDVQTISAVSENGTALEADDWRLQGSPLNGRPPRYLQRLQLAGWLSPVAVTATWGWSSVPDSIKQACIMLTARWYQRTKTPTGTATYQDGSYHIRTMDPDIHSMLAAYRILVVG